MRITIDDKKLEVLYSVLNKNIARPRNYIFKDTSEIATIGEITNYLKERMNK